MTTERAGIRRKHAGISASHEKSSTNRSGGSLYRLKMLKAQSRKPQNRKNRRKFSVYQNCASLCSGKKRFRYGKMKIKVLSEQIYHELDGERVFCGKIIKRDFSSYFC